MARRDQAAPLVVRQFVLDQERAASAQPPAPSETGEEVAARAGHTSVVTVLDRYGHLLPGTQERVTDALDALARGAARG